MWAGAPHLDSWVESWLGSTGQRSHLAKVCFLAYKMGPV